MKSYQRTRCKAYDLAIGHLEEHASLLKEVPALQEVVKSARNIFDEINAIEISTGINKTGITESKKQLQHNLAEKTHTIASMISAFALKNGNAVLKAEVKLSKSALQFAADQPLQVYCGNVVARARELSEELKPYGLTGAMLEELVKLYEQYQQRMNDPRKSTAERKEAVARVSAMIRELAQLLLKQADPLMRQFEKTQPEFYAQYRVKRIIGKNSQRKTRMAGLVTGQDPAMLMSGVSVSIKGTENAVVTDENGNYDINTPAQIPIILVFTKKGFKTAEREVVPKRGFVGLLDVKLEAE